MADEEGMAWEGGWEGESPAATAGLLTPDAQIFLPPQDINPLGYSKYPLDRFIEASYQGDLELLGKMLDREDPVNGYHADINARATDMNALQAAAVNGQLEAVEMLLKARADPHVKTCMPYGRDPKDGETAREMAEKFGWQDIVEVLAKAEKASQKGLYMKYGPNNNAKLYPIDRPQGLDPEQERRALAKHKKIVRPVPKKAERKFYGSLVFGVNFGHNENGKLIKASGQYGDESLMLEAGARPGEADGPYVGLLFPPESAVKQGMLADMASSEQKALLDTAKNILGFDLQDTCVNGPEEKLYQLEVAQAAVYVASVAAFEKLKSADPEKYDQVGWVAGLQTGEYSALTAAGVLPFELGLEVVKARAAIVAEAMQTPPQLTMTVAGLEKEKLEALCKQVRETSKNVCEISSELFPKGFMCAGAASAMNELKSAASGAGALQSTILEYTTAHSSLMKPASEKLEKVLKEMLPKLSPPTCDMFLNSTGAVVPKGTDPKELVPLLCAQLTSTVHWHDCMKGMIAAGVREFIEVGPMTQLTMMMKRIDQGSFSNMTNVEI